MLSRNRIFGNKQNVGLRRIKEINYFLLSTKLINTKDLLELKLHCLSEGYCINLGYQEAEFNLF